MEINFFNHAVSTSPPSSQGSGLPRDFLIGWEKKLSKQLNLPLNQIGSQVLTVDANRIQWGQKTLVLSAKNRTRAVRTIIDLIQHQRVFAASSDRANLAPEPLYHFLQKRQISSGSFSAQVAGLTGTGSDALSVVRHTFNSLFPSGPIYQVINQIGVISGTGWTGLSIYEILSGISDKKQVSKIQDSEGVSRSVGRISSGVLGLLGSLFYLGGKWVEIGGDPLSMAATGLNLSSAGFFGLGSILGTAIASAGIHRCRTFHAKIEKILSLDLDEETKYNLAVAFIQNSVQITDLEKVALAGEYGNNTLQFFQAVENLLETKINFLKRRSSVKALYLIAQSIGEKGALTLDQKKDLIENVQKEIRKKKLIHSVSLIASLIGVIAYVGCAIASSGILPYVCFVASSVIMLSAAIYNYYMKRKDRPIPLPPKALSLNPA